MKGKKIALTVLLTLALCLAVTGAALAMSSASFDLPWTVLSAGGGDRGSSNYALGDTAGQSSAIGLSQSTNYRLGSGYWYRVSEILPAPEAVTEFILDTDDDASGGKVGITEVREPDTGDLLPEVLIGGYEAQFTYDGDILNVLEVRHKSPFSGTQDIDDDGGITTFNGLAVAGASPPVGLAFLTMRLMASVDDQFQGTLEFTSIVDDGGSPLVPSPPQISYNFRRGDAKADGEVTIADALFICQYLVRLRDIGGDPDNEVHPVNAASVKHDEDFDEITIADALFICQYLVRLRDGYFEPVGG